MTRSTRSCLIQPYRSCRSGYVEVEGTYVYAFAFGGEILQRGEASSPQVIAVLFDEFCRWRAAVDREPA